VKGGEPERGQEPERGHCSFSGTESEPKGVTARLFGSTFAKPWRISR
jgi:hypothetical protein